MTWAIVHMIVTRENKNVERAIRVCKMGRKKGRTMFHFCFTARTNLERNLMLIKNRLTKWITLVRLRRRQFLTNMRRRLTNMKNAARFFLDP